jgi:hypothetical protein
MLAALAAFGEFVAFVFTVVAMTDENGNQGCTHERFMHSHVKYMNLEVPFCGDC